MAGPSAANLAAEAALKERDRDDRGDEIARLKGKVGEMAMETELLREKIDRLEAAPSMDLAYGLARVTRCWKLSRATVYRHRRPAPKPSRRPGPVGPCDDATLLKHIRKAISESRSGEGHRKIWARRRFSGIRS